MERPTHAAFAADEAASPIFEVASPALEVIEATLELAESTASVQVTTDSTVSQKANVESKASRTGSRRGGRTRLRFRR